MIVHLLFDGPPGPQCGRFIEAETPQGQGLNVGRWVDRGDGTWALIVDLHVPPITDPEALRNESDAEVDARDAAHQARHER